MNCNNLELGYSLLLENKLDEAYTVFDKNSMYDIRADWGKKLIPILKTNTPKDYPSYLQVRNFLELDFDLFLENKKDFYVENILNNGNFFYEICRESYKFLGRALYINQYYDLALKYFLIAKDRFYRDSELHYLLGKLYTDIGEKESSKHALKTCLELLPNYEPAIKILKNLY